MIKLNLEGKKFNRWTVIDRTGKYPRYWRCICDCGTERFIYTGDLTSNHTKSCGCYKIDNPPRRRHGMTDTRFYLTWSKILRRIRNKNCKEFIYYGGRGIKIQKSWEKFDNFMIDMYKSYLEACNKFGEKNVSIERINFNGNYSIDNCKWIHVSEQTQNTRKSIFVSPIISIISFSISGFDRSPSTKGI